VNDGTAAPGNGGRTAVSRRTFLAFLAVVTVAACTSEEEEEEEPPP